MTGVQTCALPIYEAQMWGSSTEALVAKVISGRRRWGGGSSFLQAGVQFRRWTTATTFGSVEDTVPLLFGRPDVMSLKISEFTYGSAIVIKEQDVQCCCTMLSSPDGDLAEEAVLLLFGFFHQRWTTTSLLLIPRFNSEDMLRLSSVMVHTAQISFTSSAYAG